MTILNSLLQDSQVLKLDIRTAYAFPLFIPCPFHTLCVQSMSNDEELASQVHVPDRLLPFSGVRQLADQTEPWPKCHYVILKDSVRQVKLRLTCCHLQSLPSRERLIGLCCPRPTGARCCAWTRCGCCERCWVMRNFLHRKWKPETSARWHKIKLWKESSRTCLDSTFDKAAKQNVSTRHVMKARGLILTDVVTLKRHVKLEISKKQKKLSFAHLVPQITHVKALVVKLPYWMLDFTELYLRMGKASDIQG